MTYLPDFGYQRFWRDERGTITHFALTVMLLVALFSGMSLDSTNAWRVRYMLQSAADAAAHAAAMELPDTGDALEAALELATDNLGTGVNSAAITSDSVEFGSWDNDTRTFSTSATIADAVRVTATRSSENANPVPTFLLRLAGFQSWNIQVDSVAWRSAGDCSNADISTNGVFELDADSDFFNGFCVEALAGMDLGGDNLFDDDNRLSVADFNDVTFPGSVGMASNVGRGSGNSSAGLTYSDIFNENADISAPYTADVDTLGDLYLNPLYEGQPAYINVSSTTITIDADDVKYTSFIPGRIYEVVCGDSAGDTAQFFSEAFVTGVVIVSECRLQLGQDAVFQDVVLVSREAGSNSVYAASGVQLGEDDECADGGGVSIFAAGDFLADSDLEAYGTYVSAVGEVQIAAAEGGIEGIAIDANGDVTFTEEGDFGACNNSTSNATEVSYLLVK